MQKSLIIATPEENNIHPLLPQYQCCPHEHCKTLVSIILQMHQKMSSKTHLHDIPCQCSNTKFIEHFQKIFNLKEFENGTKPFENQLIQMRKSYQLIWKEVQVLNNENIRLSEQNQKLSKQRQQMNNKISHHQGEVRRISTNLKERYQGKIEKLLTKLQTKEKIQGDWSSLDLTGYDQCIIRNSKFINSQQEQLLKSEFLNCDQNQFKATTAHFLEVTEDHSTKRNQRKSSKLAILMNSSSENQISFPSQKSKNHNILLNQIEKRDHQIISLKSACHMLKQQVQKLKSFIKTRQQIQESRHSSIMHLKQILSDLDI